MKPVINASDIAGLNTTFGAMPKDVRENYGAGVTLAFNHQWGNQVNFGTYFTPGKVMTVYYDSPYNLEKTKSFLKIIGQSDTSINPFFGNGVGPQWHIPIWDWDANNRYFQMHYDDLKNFTGVEDFTHKAISMFRFVIFLAGEDESYKEDGKIFIGPKPVTLLGARIGDPVEVAWMVSGNTSASTNIGRDGMLSVGKDETAEKLTVKAILNGTAGAEAVINVQ